MDKSYHAASEKITNDELRREFRVGHFLSSRQQKELIAWFVNPIRDFASYDELLVSLKIRNPYAFLTKDELALRVFFHRPKGLIPYKHCIINEKISND